MAKTVKRMRQRQATGQDLRLKTAKLLLDDENPRLAASKDGASDQAHLTAKLWTEMAADEIALSIANNGFFPEERLFVIARNAREREGPNKKYIVVEGNRRLTAVRVLLDDELRNHLRAHELPRLTDAQKSALRELPVSVYRNREELWQYFGFRHINGPKPWDSYSKAIYISEVHEEYGISLDRIAHSIGDRHSTVARLYRGLKIFEQAERSRTYSTGDRVKRRLAFSHLYTAAAQPEYQKFLGITDHGSLKRNPVARANLSQLRELLVWLYGSKSEKKEPLVRTQAPDLNRLREVISSRKGLDALRAGFSLDRSHEISTGDVRRFRESIVRAKEDLQQAKATVTTGFDGDEDLLEMMVGIERLVESLQAEMKTKGQRRRA